VLPDSTSRIDREPHVDAAPMPRVLAVEQVDTEEAPGLRRAPRGAHRGLVGQRLKLGVDFCDLELRGAG
jgi:hypothetical protein